MKKAVLLAFVLVLSSVSMFVESTKPVEASGTIYVRPDGSIDSPTANITTVDNITYTFTDNNYDSIYVYRDNIVIDGAGYTLEGHFAASRAGGIEMFGRTNVTIRKLNIKEFDFGVSVSFECSSINIFRNNITMNKGCGIHIYNSSNIIVSANNVIENGFVIGACGIVVSSVSSNNILTGNNISANRDCGIQLDECSNSEISENIVSANNRWGIKLLDSANNIFSGNNITANGEYGIYIGSSTDNSFYHNNFVGNPKQLPSHYSRNFWDDGYPSGGNYWSNYNGTDSDGDGIGDTPYIINKNNQDRYPLINPWTSAWSPETTVESPFWMEWWFWAIVAVVVVVLVGAIYLLKRGKPPISTVPPLPSEGVT